jgi:hypothetical protein
MSHSTRVQRTRAPRSSGRSTNVRAWRERTGGFGSSRFRRATSRGRNGRSRTCSTAVPRSRPPDPDRSSRASGGRPTLIQNVETLAHLADHRRVRTRPGSRSIGTADTPGSMLLTVVRRRARARRVRGARWARRWPDDRPGGRTLGGDRRRAWSAATRARGYPPDGRRRVHPRPREGWRPRAASSEPGSWWCCLWALWRGAKRRASSVGSPGQSRPVRPRACSGSRRSRGPPNGSSRGTAAAGELDRLARWAGGRRGPGRVPDAGRGDEDARAARWTRLRARTCADHLRGRRCAASETTSGSCRSRDSSIRGGGMTLRRLRVRTRSPARGTASVPRLLPEMIRLDDWG